MDGPQAGRAYAEPSGALPSFETVRKGFNREQVLVHLHLVVERISDLETRLDRAKRDLRTTRVDLERSRDECDQARRRVDELQSMVDSISAGDRDPYAGVSQHVMELVHEFERDVELLRTKADIDSRRIVANARTEAANKRIEAVGSVREARRQADRLLQEARDNAANVRARLRPLRELTLSQAEALRDRMRTSLLELEGLMATGLDDAPIVVGEAQEEHPNEAPTAHPSPGDGLDARRYT
jgi:cell division septum initiation protein DivIVA